MRAAADTFGAIPVGDTTMDLEADSLKMPEKLNINYDDQIANVKSGEQREFKEGDRRAQVQPETRTSQQQIGKQGSNIIDLGGSQPQQPVSKNTKSLLDDDDDVPQPQNTVKQPFNQPIATNVNQPVKTSDPFDILGLDLGGSSTQPAKQATTGNTGGIDLMGFSFNTPPVQTQPVQNQQSGGFGSLLDDGLLGGGFTNTQPKAPQVQPTFTQPQNQSLGFDFLGTGSTSTTPVNNPVTQPTQPIATFQQPPQQQQQQNSHKFKAY